MRAFFCGMLCGASRQNLCWKSKARGANCVSQPAAEPTRTLPHPESFGPHMFDAPIKSPVHQLLKGLDSHRGTGFGSGHALAQQDDTTTSDDSDNGMF